jgi:hypothetical protein
VGGVLLLQGVPVTQWPLAARSAYTQAPGLFDTVLQHAGWCVLTLPTGTPPEAVRQAVTQIGNQTQRTFISTWLPPLIETHRPPVLSTKDFIKLSPDRLQQNVQTITGYVD